MQELRTKSGLDLQWQMLIGFLVGLIAGLIVYSTARDAAWVETFTTYVTEPIGQVFPFLDSARTMVDEPDRISPGIPAIPGLHAGFAVDGVVVLELHPGDEGLVERVERGDRRGALDLGDECVGDQAIQGFDLAVAFDFRASSRIPNLKLLVISLELRYGHSAVNERLDLHLFQTGNAAELSDKSLPLFFRKIETFDFEFAACELEFEIFAIDRAFHTDHSVPVDCGVEQC